MPVFVESVPKPARCVGSSHRGLKSVPRPVQRNVGLAFYAAECGEEYPGIKALKAFSGRSVLEIIALHDGDRHRAVNTVRLQDAVYVLHAFQKRGIATSQRDLERIQLRLAAAEWDHEGRQVGNAKN